ncbi:MAG: SPFH domain-containing protein [Gammaproteobacteria bacterium]|nr:SPFH domain-containing protein [Gammaproteobacteria bacterium]
MFQGFTAAPLMLVVSVVLLVAFFLAVLVSQYKRCPSNRILVVYGKVGGQRAARCIHGGGTFVVPLLQSYSFLTLEPLTIDIELKSALSKKNIRVNVPSTFTIGVSTDPNIMNNASERLLGLDEHQINTQAKDIILGQMRLVIATLSIEEINQDREKFLDLVNKNVNFELNKIGLEMINVNIRDITDESGYIEALGQKAAAEAINQAKIEVAAAERQGAIGEAENLRQRDVQVAQQNAQAATGTKAAERDQRVQVAKLEAEGVAGEATAAKEKEIAVAQQSALSVEGKKKAEAQQRIQVAGLEASAIEGENKSKASIADYEAELAKRRAAAKRTGEVAMAEASRDVLLKEKEAEIARLEKLEVARQIVEQRKVEIDADAEAERIRRVAQGEADAILAKYTAEADGTRKVLQAKSEGYEALLAACADRKDIAPALLMIEQLPALVAEQVKAIQNLKIEKITVWDGAGGHDGTSTATAGFLRGMINALPPIHDLAKQAGIELPEALGKVEESETRKPARDSGKAAARAKPSGSGSADAPGGAG